MKPSLARFIDHDQYLEISKHPVRFEVDAANAYV